MGYLWCPADWTKGEQTKAVARPEGGEELDVIRPKATDLHLFRFVSLRSAVEPHSGVVSGEEAHFARELLFSSDHTGERRKW